MNFPSLALVQMDVIPGQPEQNLSTALRLLQEARNQGASLVAFPELCLSGYLIGDLWEEYSFVRDCVAAGHELVTAGRNLVLLFGNVGVDLEHPGEDGRPRRYNAAWLAEEGQLRRNPWTGLDFIPKTLLPNYREFEETRHFFDLRRLALERGVPVQSLFGIHEVKCGSGNLPLGVILCEDGWGEDYHLHLIPHLAEQGAQLVINLSASPYTRGKNGKRNRIFSQQATQSRIPIAYVNCIGAQNNGKTFFGFDGSSTFYGTNGQIRTTLPAWKECVQVIDGASPESVDSGNSCVSGISPSPSPWAGHSELRPEDVQTLIQVVRRYLEQSGIARVVVGVSGGIDSAVAAAL
ncbi:MAG TPA: nitrilase-related carbon-nitrogen hydrolase, partial [Fibrobacteraceae bacterium]|nr:nitrilase-related carbon-nitrogen hydrolase [Fibrobacteraceae bacterium]